VEHLAFIVIFWVGIPRVSSQSLLGLGDFLIWKIRFTPTENPGDMQVPKSLVKVVKHPMYMPYNYTFIDSTSIQGISE
jgi:hypothetical protein